ncbi:hypothetical protein [Nocardioides massiliensis]|uniref:Uncharacterized protein n=1 Tax=Nocardioides massiliensis TaxID=1325935 RepID=A0ABT9NJ11_9ACTN|nr:hypothetical protein [Nocardioides massiliensis]MDP9820389.1 hypothetical protein [Nocardioides massiliensis]
MAENSNGTHVLAGKDFVDLVDEADEVVGSVPKHWRDDQLPPGTKKKGRSSRSSSTSTPTGGGQRQQTPSTPSGEPAGNASREDWAAYAVTQGAEEKDLVDDKGEPLGRDELRAKYGQPQS